MALQLVHITDKGATRPSNQDSFCARISNFGRETIAMLAVCDGVGGLQSGELASTGAVRCFEEWFERQLPEIVQSGLTADVVFFSWHRMLETLHTALCSYSGKTGIQLGTTVSALLLTRDALYQVQVGDSRIYLDDGLGLVQLSKDQTLAMREVEAGRLSPEAAVSCCSVLAMAKWSRFFNAQSVRCRAQCCCAATDCATTQRGKSCMDC